MQDELTWFKASMEFSGFAEVLYFLRKQTRKPDMPILKDLKRARKDHVSLRSKRSVTQ
jgi:hypothetical protein